MKQIRLYIQALTTVLFTFSIGIFAHADGNALDFEAHPAHPSLVDQKISSYFYEMGKSGDTITDTITVSNPNKYPITIQPSIVKATTAINGGLSFENQPLSTSWIKGLENDVTLSPKSSKNIPFQIEIPLKTKPGDYLVGISLVDHPPASNQSNAGKSNISVEIKQQIRRIITVEVSIPGSVKPRVDWSTPLIINEPSGPSLDINGFNKNQVLLHEISGSISLLKDGKTLWNVPLSNITLAANEPFQFKYRWKEGYPETGRYMVHVNLTGNQINHIQKDLPFDISVANQKQYQDLTGKKTIQSYIPQWVYWVVGGALILLIGSIFILLTMYRKMKGYQKKKAKYKSNKI